MSLTDEQLAELRASVDEVDMQVGHGEAAHNSPALQALTAAKTLLAEVAEAKAELDATKKNRLIAAIFGHHPGAPKPLALYRRHDETGVSGTGIVAEGAEFSDGMVVLRWLSEFPTSVVFHERGIESVEAVHGHAGKTQIVWLSDELEPLSAMSQERDSLRDRIDEVLTLCDDASQVTGRVGYVSANAIREIFGEGDEGAGTALPPAIEGCICSHTVHMEVPGAPVELNADADCPIHGEKAHHA